MGHRGCFRRQQQSELDPQKRAQIIYKRQQIMYDQSPQLTLTYPRYLQAYDTKDWTGWTRILGGHGPAICCAGNIATHLNVKATSATTTSSSINWIIVVVVVLLCVVVPIAIWLVVRRKSRVEEM